METAATILHADLDAFYASVEQLLDPSLRGSPLPSVAVSYLPPLTRPRPSGCAAACRGGAPVSSARTCSSSTVTSRSTSGSAMLPSRCWVISHRWSSGCRSTKRSPMSPDVNGSLGHPVEIAKQIRRRVRSELGLPISVGVARTKHLAKIASQVAKPDGLVVVDPATELAFLHDLPVELMWGVGPVTKARLADVGVVTIGQLAHIQPRRLEALLGRALGDKLAALAWNRDPREIKIRRRSQSAGAQSALGRQPAEERVFRPTLLHLADRIATRLREKSRPGRTVTVRVRFADMRSVTRSVTLPAPISATRMLAEVAEDLVRGALADYPQEKTISLLAISVSNLEEHPVVQLELPIGLEDEPRRPGSKQGMARQVADRAVDAIRNRFGWGAVGYGSVRSGMSRSVPDEFRQLAEKEL